MKIKQITFTAYKTLIINNITLLKITFGEISLLLGIGTGLKPAPTQQEKRNIFYCVQFIFRNFPLNPFCTSPICRMGNTKVSCIYILSLRL